MHARASLCVCVCARACGSNGSISTSPLLGRVKVLVVGGSQDHCSEDEMIVECGKWGVSE